MVRSGALFAALAASGAALCADALSLRQHMENQMKASGKSMTLQRETNQAKCQPQRPGKEERMCSPSESVSNAGQATCRDCSQICHVWGDPHLAPFVSDQTVNVFTNVGTYTLWKWPGAQQDKPIDFEVTVTKQKSDIGNKPWITEVRLNGDTLLTVAECKANKDANVFEKITMSSDPKRSSNANDMYVEYYVGCRWKHNVYSLEVWIKVHDDNSPENAAVKNQLGPYSWSTRQLLHDTGACVAWLTYGKDKKFDTPEAEEKAHEESLANDFNAHRTSDVKNAAGRTCTCAAECAIWGDPYVNSFYQAATRSAKKNFQIPKSSVITNAQRILYQVQNKFAVSVEMDRCEFISVVRVYVVRDSCLKKMESCNYNQATSPDWLDDTCYQEFVVDATKQCTDAADFAAKTRKTIQVPSNFPEWGEEFFNDAFNGYAAGMSVLDGDKATGTLIPVSSNNPDKCAKNLGVDPNTLVQMGGVRAVMKCHINTDNEAYFNVCIQREGLETLDGQMDPQVSDVQTMELQGRTSGWCATGDFTNGGEAATMAESSFTYRAAGQTQTFALATDSQ